MTPVDNEKTTLGRMRSSVVVAALSLALLVATACTGDAGADGPDGSIGPPGRPGLTGDIGLRGETGPSGFAGVPGPEGSQGVAGKAGARGQQGPAGETPSDESITELIEAALLTTPSLEGPVIGDPVAGGKLYDNWVTITGAEIDGDHALWSLQSANARSGAATVRCKECHGWDYKGAGGAYSSGSHFTGFTGVIRAARALSQDELIEVLKGGNDFRHDFSGLMGDAEIESLAAFLKTELINDAVYIDYATKAPRQAVNADRGRLNYNRTCGTCHGGDGTDINFGSEASPVYIGTIANDNPWEFVHKTRFGQPGERSMPASEERGWTLEEVFDVLGHAQTLPRE